ncbi:YbaB/EbfC family nucleoid-associated protein [Kutzneria sp. CA-103260]|uniref:YbaB/EbfC family nucleoid-associated protein n=1 Tax=Kutzneria sp. CA-103260 TaxID=2802641 RepID=UPI001BA6F4A3|nr:YbaB/EbfC family nucleoid-associated protein [Kutzneria sp. CA-103260]QUQ70625.1 Nucleoid-associated protein YbaB [Kutzneria sp. CA-103260]
MNQDTAARLAAFQRNVAQAENDVDRFTLMQQEIVAIETTETSRDGGVTVVAGPAGAVRSITISPSAMGMSAQALSRLVTTTFQQAVAKAARQQAEIVQRYAGDRTDIAARVNKVQEELANPPQPPADAWHDAPPHPEPQVQPPVQPQHAAPAPRPAAPARPPRSDDDEEFRFGSEDSF